MYIAMVGMSPASKQRPAQEHSSVGWLLLAAAFVLCSIVFLVTVLSIGRNESAMSSLLADKGAALIRAFEGGLRTGMRSQVGVRLQAMLQEMAGGDILFATVVMPDGTIIAHSSPGRLGEILTIDTNEVTPDTMHPLVQNSRDGDVHWDIMHMEGKRVFVVYRNFTPIPLRKGKQSGKNTPVKAVPSPIIFLGLDVSPFETARASARFHLLSVGTGLVLVGCACLLVLYFAQRARESRRRQRLAEGQVRLLEEKVRRKEKLAAIGNLAAGVAHEIRNPLSSIKGYATYFGQRFPENSDDREAAQVMVREVERLNRVITDLIGLSRPTDVRVVPTDILPLIHHALKLIAQDAENKNIVTDLRAPKHVPQVLVDQDRFSQAVLNVCLNAIDAMPDGGRLNVVLALDKNRLCIEISDTGAGILPKDLNHIFDPYFTTKGHGTGLGLATVHKIVEAHGGEITVHSQHKSIYKKSGTTFRIYLPLAPTEQTHA